MLVCADVLCLYIALFLAILLRYDDPSQGFQAHELAILAIAPFITVLIFLRLNLPSRKLPKTSKRLII